MTVLAGTALAAARTGAPASAPASAPAPAPVPEPESRPAEAEPESRRAGPAFAPAFGPDAATVEASRPFPEREPIALRAGFGPTFVIARRTVPTLGYQLLVEGSYTWRMRTELGGLFAYFVDADSRHFTLAATFEWKIGRARKGALFAGGAVGLTYVIFDDAPKAVTAFDTRARFGWEVLLGRAFTLRLEFLGLSLKVSTAFGAPVVPAWEPRLLLGARF